MNTVVDLIKLLEDVVKIDEKSFSTEELVKNIEIFKKQALKISSLIEETKSGLLLPSEIAKILENNPYEGTKAEGISFHDNHISFIYVDPNGEWETSEYDENEYVLTQNSERKIAQFLKSLTPQITKVYFEYPHLADVKITFYIKRK